MTDKRKIAVVGGGASGLTAAGRAAALGCEVTVFERNAAPGKKLGITGKGRCNLTNDCTPEELIKNVTANGKFLYSAIHRFSPSDTMAFFEALGVPLKTERGRRVFPVSDRAADVVHALMKYCERGGCRLLHERVTALIRHGDGRICGVRCGERSFDGFDAVILCTGGVSYPGTGSTGDGYRLAESVGHTVTPLLPSLVGLESDDPLCAAAQGLSLKNAAITVADAACGKEIFRDFGEMLFCHYGISGPVILSASAHMRPMEKDRYSVFIDLKPALDRETLDCRLLADFDRSKNRDFRHAFDELLPSKLREPFAARCGIPLDKKIHAVTREERSRIVSLLKGLAIPITGFRPIAEAIVTSGGVRTSEIDPHTMCSKFCPNLYFAGEIIDVDAYTGGFNLQIAFSTAMAAAEAAAIQNGFKGKETTK